MQKNTFLILSSEHYDIDLDGIITIKYSAKQKIEDISREIKEKINSHCRTATCITFEDSFAPLALTSFRFPKLVRGILAINPTARANPSLFHRVLDSIESKLPLGLPFRMNSGIDSKPYLHRLRYPVVVVNTKGADTHTKQESKSLESKMPIVWKAPDIDGDLKSNIENFKSDTNRLLEQLKQIPNKCPQKRRVSNL